MECYVLNRDFRFFSYRYAAKFCRSIHFGLVTLIDQVSFQQLFILLRGGSRAASICKMEHKRCILDVAAALDPPLLLFLGNKH